MDIATSMSRLASIAPLIVLLPPLMGWVCTGVVSPKQDLNDVMSEALKLENSTSAIDSPVPSLPASIRERWPYAVARSPGR